MPTIRIKQTNTKVSAAIVDYFTKNINKLSKFLHEENKIMAELELERKHKSGQIYRAEITIMPKSEVYAEARGGDFYEAIDLLMPKVKEQVVKYKDKIVSNRRRRVHAGVIEEV